MNNIFKIMFALALVGFIALPSCKDTDLDDLTSPNDNEVVASGSTNSASHDQEVDTWPVVIDDYIDNNYPTLTVDLVEFDDEDGYEVHLSDGSEVYFDLDGNFLSVETDDDDDGDGDNDDGFADDDDDADGDDDDDNGDDDDDNGDDDDEGDDDDDGMDDDIVVTDWPTAIDDYLNANYPDLSILFVELEDSLNFEVYLSDGTEVNFDLDGNFLSVDNNNDDIVDTWPSAIDDYLIFNFSDRTISYVELDDNQYEVYLSDGTEVIFDLEGNFLFIDNGDDDDDEGDDDDDGDDDDEGDDDDDDGGEPSDTTGTGIDTMGIYINPNKF